MKEKYKFGYTDPRAMYGSKAVELEEPEVKCEFLERYQYDIAAAAVHLIGLVVLMLLMVLL